MDSGVDDEASPSPGFPIRASPDQRLRAAPRCFSQLVTPFVACPCQGIHRAPLFAWPDSLARLSRDVATRPTVPFDTHVGAPASLDASLHPVLYPNFQSNSGRGVRCPSALDFELAFDAVGFRPKTVTSRAYSPLQKGGDPAAGSPTATLLRLRPSHRARLRRLPPLRVGSPTSGAPDSHGVTGGVYKARERIHRGVADPRLLAIPASCSRVTDCNPNLDRVFPIRSASRPRFGLSRPL
jgi:hypothetical protein